MKRITLFLAAMAMAIAAHSQTITIDNASDCSIQYYVTASDGSCSSFVTSIMYMIPPNSSVTHSFGTITWLFTPSFTPTQWRSLKGSNFCGPLTWSYVTCTSSLTVNDNLIGLGIPCSGLGLSNCADMDVSCNTCSWIRAIWLTSGGNTIVSIGS